MGACPTSRPTSRSRCGRRWFVGCSTEVSGGQRLYEPPPLRQVRRRKVRPGRAPYVAAELRTFAGVSAAYGPRCSLSGRATTALEHPLRGDTPRRYAGVSRARHRLAAHERATFWYLHGEECGACVAQRPAVAPTTTPATRPRPRVTQGQMRRLSTRPRYFSASLRASASCSVSWVVRVMSVSWRAA